MVVNAQSPFAAGGSAFSTFMGNEDLLGRHWNTPFGSVDRCGNQKSVKVGCLYGRKMPDLGFKSRIEGSIVPRKPE